MLKTFFFCNQVPQLAFLKHCFFLFHIRHGKLNFMEINRDKAPSQHWHFRTQPLSETVNSKYVERLIWRCWTLKLECKTTEVWAEESKYHWHFPAAARPHAEFHINISTMNNTAPVSLRKYDIWSLESCHMREEAKLKIISKNNEYNANDSVTSPPSQCPDKWWISG